MDNVHWRMIIQPAARKLHTEHCHCKLQDSIGPKLVKLTKPEERLLLVKGTQKTIIMYLPILRRAFFIYYFSTTTLDKIPFYISPYTKHCTLCVEHCILNTAPILQARTLQLPPPCTMPGPSLPPASSLLPPPSSLPPPPWLPPWLPLLKPP